jgi:predicted nucleic acid-binding Zn ribbon protein
MAFYRVCPDCGANLDPGEKCDCGRERAHIEKEKQRRSDEILKRIVVEHNGQLRFTA